MRTTLFISILVLSNSLTAQLNSAFTAHISHATEEGWCIDGSIDLELNEGLGPYEFEWIYFDGINPGVPQGHTNEDLDNLRPYQYCVQVTDALCGTASACFQVDCCPSPPRGMVVDYCSMDSPGSIHFNLDGSGYDLVRLTNGDGYQATGHDFTLLDPGSYKAEFTNASGCRVVHEYDVRDHGFSIELAGLENIDECWGGHACRGAVDIEISGARSQVSYAWYPYGKKTLLSREQDIDRLCEGSYTVVVTSDDGCSVTRDFEICCCTEADWNGIDLIVQPGDCYRDKPEEIRIGVVEILPESADGAGDGSIDIVVTGGTGQFAFEWTKQGGDAPSGQFPRYTEDISQLSEGTYCVSVTDGCDSGEKCFEVTRMTCDDVGQCHEGRGFLLFEQVNVFDAGVQMAHLSTSQEMGRIEATIFSLAFPISIQLMSQSGEVQSWTQDQYGTWSGEAVPGAYCLVVTDAYGCRISRHIVIDQCTGGGISVDLDFSGASPFDATDPGFVGAYITGGSGPYQIEFGHVSVPVTGTSNNYQFIDLEQANFGFYEAMLLPCSAEVDAYYLKIEDSDGNCHWQSFAPPCYCVESYFPDLNWKVVNPCFNNGLFSPNTKVKLSVPPNNSGSVGGLANHTYTILWPNGQTSTFTTEQVNSGNGNSNIEYSLSGPDKYIVPDQDPFSIFIYTEFGCFIERRYHLYEPTDGQTFNTTYLNNFIGPSAFDAYHFVTTGCEVNNTCGYEAVLMNGDYIYPPRIFYNYQNFEQFEYSPPSPVSPCSGGGTIFSNVCDLEITIPQSFNGTELIDYAQEPLVDENGCYYPCGCLFSNSYVNAYGIENDVLVMSKKYINCDDPGSPGDCAEVNILSYDMDNCEFTFECLPSGNVYTEPTPTSQCLYTEADGTCSWVDYCPGSGLITATLEANVDCEDEGYTPCFAHVTRLHSGSPQIEVRSKPAEQEETAVISIAEKKLVVYPNPFSHGLNIDISRLEIPEGSVKIYNAVGQLVFEEKIGPATGDKLFFTNQDNIHTGLYTIIVHNHDQNTLFIEKAVCID